MNRKGQLLLALTAGLVSCGGNPWVREGQVERLVMENVQVRPGGHCESSALLNAMLYQGYDFEEYHIAGGGGAMGFLYQSGAFPFLGGRSLTMKEVFLDAAGIRWHVGDNSSPEAAWAGVEDLLARDCPVVLRVDMRYLPYLYGGKYGPRYTSFGWHVVTLFGIDYSQEIAWVSDTDRPGLQEINLRDLEKARSSNTKMLPPNREYYWVEDAPEDFQVDWASMQDRAVAEWIRNYQAEMDSVDGIGGLEGLRVFGEELRKLPRQTKPFLLPSAVGSLHGWIEEFGTGGASFRVFTRDFMADMGHRLDDPRIAGAVELLNASIEAWHALSSSLQTAGERMKDLRTLEDRLAAMEAPAEQAEVLAQREEALYRYLVAHWEE